MAAPAWHQTNQWDSDPWPAPTSTPRRIGRRKGRTCDKGKGAGGKGKKGKDKGKGAGGKAGKQDAVRDWSTGDLTREEKRAIEGQRWKAWTKQAGK